MGLEGIKEISNRPWPKSLTLNTRESYKPQLNREHQRTTNIKLKVFIFVLLSCDFLNCQLDCLGNANVPVEIESLH